MKDLAHPGSRKSDPLLWIGAIKLLKGLGLILLAVLLLRVTHGSVEDNLRRWLAHLRIGSGIKHLHRLIKLLTGVPRSRLHLMEVGTFLYAALYLTEGVGLLCRQRWAEWLTTIGTSLFLPFEVYELFHRFTWPRAAVLTINAIIVFYLALRLRRDHAPPPVAPSDL